MALGKRKGFTAKQSKRTARRMDDSTYGTHVSRGSHSRGFQQNASTVQFSNPRSTDRVARGTVETITPATQSGESAAEYRRRASQRRYIEEVQRKAKRRRIITFIVVALIVVGLAVGAGMIAFKGTVGAEMSLGDSDAKSALVTAKDGEPTYTLISVELGAVAQPLERSGPDVLLLARLDEQSRTVALLNIPADLRVTLGDSEYHRICEASQEGDSALIEAVSKFCGVPISHFVKLSKQNLVDLVDALDGVDMEVSQVVDDPHAGDVYLSAGAQTLEGNSALTFLRATNLKLGTLDQMNNQLDFAASLLDEVFREDGSVGFSKRLESIDTFFKTDYTFDDIVKLQSWLKDVDLRNMTLVTVPGYTTAVTGVVDNEVSYYIASSNDVAIIIDTLDQGGDPNASKNEASALDKSSFTVEVQNGANIVGAAAETAETL
ncbi:MAG: LCP family protein, partial [Eggerthellaceae bacterium]|nr:LCP family protein [Eggerthellaceae bacterium]